MKFIASAVLAVAAAKAATAFIPLSSFSTPSSTTTKPAPVGTDLVVVNDNMNNNKYRRSVSFLSSSTETEEAATEEDASAEKFEFTSDVGRVMDLIINSLYSDRDIFLRELISNAADACDKKRFLSITDGEEGDVEAPPAIKIKCDVDTNTVTIEDSGVGMTKDEIINNLGKIAQSGTRAFAQALGDGKSDVNLIGQFGVGFYSAFLVADKVTVVTKSMQDNTKAYKWESEADSSYSISDASPEEIDGTSGTKLILQLKEDASTYLEPSKIEELLQRYSEFIEFPMSVWKEKTDYKQVPDEEANKDLEEEASKKKEELNRENVDVISYLETILTGKVEKVTVSDLLTDSPAALVQGAYGMSPSMQRYMKAQTVASGQELGGLDSMNKVCMEINPNHPIVKDLSRMVKADKTGKEAEDFAKLLFDVAGMTSGYDIEDMSGFAKRVMGLMGSPQAVDETQDAVVESEDKAVEEEKSEEEEKAVGIPDAVVDEEKKGDDDDEEKAVEVEVIA
ncbi:hypothetical protein FRACYDRAFT_264526 [Fragilariopsis cylindrus CCMP1102]|uniref:Histidine kinase/HSP90-like ATPase domain-containing protein n=1 Tax=Fragilariopsis cylindrus CCMP1102 TaxID=635003 RepID=A0A1E7ERZ7_9STRA|nr:hypothetical protein FRACYDRAFT_264526 [Fragilariopsis cylindrus CCMP1102]|eukprot:OEU08741.1 hypothetical protein FRACYDRAFT_264526 [Fragilariopsis cylindrus CCMP1102]